MAVPTTREQFKQFCLRALGKPVIEINVDDDQVDDRIDEALKYYMDYHFDGSEKVYYRHVVTDGNYPGKINEVLILNGGTGYSNSDVVVFTNAAGDISGGGANATITTNSSGTITAVTMVNHGNGSYRLDPRVTITTSTGSGASLEAHKGGYIRMPENIMGVVRIFDIGSYIASNNMFNIRYQIALNDLYTLTYQSMVPYYMTFQHLQFLEQLLIGQQPIRYNRHTNRLYIDVNWEKLEPGAFLLVEAYEVVDPAKFPDVWSDRWLQQYCIERIKKQWGSNLKKFGGVQMLGGVTFNGQVIYDEAEAAIAKLEAEMIGSYSLPVMDMIG